MGLRADGDRLTRPAGLTMLPRFLVPGLDAAADEVALPPDEAHHLLRVLRLRPGDEVVVIDGRGLQYRATVSSTTGRRATVSLSAPLPAVSGPRVALTLVQSVLKPDSMDAVIRDCTMIGVSRIAPVVSERTAVKTALLPKLAERWRRVAVSSVKQCGRARIPDIAAALPFANVTPEAPGFMLVEPAAVAAGQAVTVRRLSRDPAPPHATLAVGPEGGWSDAEQALGRTLGYVPLTLGSLTLRAESVPLAACAALLSIWDE